MIRHVVLWRLADELRRDTSLMDMVPIHRSVEAMQAQVPGLLRADIARVSADGADGVDLAFYCEFASWDALRDYEDHPLHLEFRRLIGPLRTERRVADYEVVVSP
jgi:hypothetical protein